MLRKLLVCWSGWMLLTLACPGQTDDFDDGDDVGWTPVDFVGQGLGYPYGLFQVTSGQYRLSSDPPPEEGLGVARLTTYRADRGYGTFAAVVDIVSWNQALSQRFGLVGRLQGNPQPGTFSGYTLTYAPVAQVLAIDRLDGEVPVRLASVPASLPPGDAYRMVFSGEGAALTGAVYNLQDPLLPLVTLSAVDATYWAGFCGLTVAAQTATAAVNVTFDSYAAGPGGKPELNFAAAAGIFTVGWPRLTGAWHLETSNTLTAWTAVRQGGSLSGGMLEFSAPISGKRYYRLAAGW